MISRAKLSAALPKLAGARLPVGAVAISALIAGCGSAAVTPAPTASIQARSVADQASCPGGQLATAGAGSGAVAGAAPACPYRSVKTLGRPGEGVLRQPEAVAVGAGGRVYVADQFSYRIQMFSSSGRYEGQWGSYGSGEGQFAAVGGLAIGPTGDVYAVDCANDRIQEFTSTGTFIRAWGSPGSGLRQLSLGAGTGPADPPGGGIAVSSAFVYVSDTLNNRIVRYSLDGSSARVIASLGSAPGQVRKPRGLAIGPALSSGGRQVAEEALYVADNGNVRVQELTPAGHFIAQVRSFPARPAEFQNPYDVAVNGDSVYVVDDNHGRIVAFDRALHYRASYTGSGPMHMTPFIRAVAAAPAGDFYVADAHANDIVHFDSSGHSIGRWGLSANEPGQFVDPVDIALGPSAGNLVVESFAGLLHLSGLNPLRWNAVWGGGGEVLLGSQWFRPSAAAFAPGGSVWVTDLNNAVVRHATYNGRFLAGAGDPKGAGAPTASSLGYAPPDQEGASGGPVHFAALAQPTGIAVLANGDPIVADAARHALIKLSASGVPLTVWHAPQGSGGAFTDPSMMAAAGQESFYVLEPGQARILYLSADDRLLGSWGTQGSGFGQLQYPSGIALGPEGHVFVDDAALGRIVVFSAAGRPLAQFGSPGQAPGQLSDPAGMAIDCAGDLLVADSGNNRIQIFAGAAAGGPCPAAG